MRASEPAAHTAKKPPVTWIDFWDNAYDVWVSANMFKFGRHTNMSRKMFWTDESGERRVCYLVAVVLPDRTVTAEIDDPLCSLSGRFHEIAHGVADRITALGRRLRDDQFYSNLTMAERARFVSDGERKRWAASWYKLTPVGLVDVRLREDHGMWHIVPVSKRALTLFAQAHQELPPQDDIPEIVRPGQLFRVLRRLRRDKLNYDPTPLGGPECEALRVDEEAEWAKIVAWHREQGLPDPL